MYDQLTRQATCRSDSGDLSVRNRRRIQAADLRYSRGDQTVFGAQSVHLTAIHEKLQLSVWLPKVLLRLSELHRGERRGTGGRDQNEHTTKDKKTS